MKVTIKDVAKAAQVSVATASMAINNRPGIKKETRDKVVSVAKELHYYPDYSARSLVTRDSNSLGLIIPEIQNPFYSAIVDYMTQLAEERGYQMLLAISNNSSQQEKAYIEMFLSKRVKGIIIVPMIANNPDIGHIDMIRNSGVPLVFCTENYGDCKEATVMCDFVKGEYDITKYLIEKGLKVFSFVSTKMNVKFAKLRYEGFLAAIQEAGLTVDQDRIFLLDHPRYPEAYQITDQIIQNLPEAIVCINDIMTIAILKRLYERGIKIPADVSLAGFDDMMFSELVQKPLTTVRHPLDKICKMSMDLLEEQMKNGSLTEEKQGKVYLIEPQLVIRETTI